MIHRYHLDDWYIVIDTCSGSVHVVDEIAYEIIGCYEEKPREEVLREMSARFQEDPAEIAECYDQVTELKEQGTLFSRTCSSPWPASSSRRPPAWSRPCASMSPTPAT